MPDGDERNRLDDQQVRDRAIRLFTFLRELTGLRSIPVRTIEQYDKVLWLNDIPRQPECRCIGWRDEGDEKTPEAWVEVRKPKLLPPPEVPQPLKPWLDPREVEDSSLEMPKLRERVPIELPGDAEQSLGNMGFLELPDHPDIAELWERYIEEEWWPWAEGDRPRQEVQRIYSELFSFYQKQQRLGETFEVVTGVGYLTWLTPNGREIRRHLITAQTSLSFEPARGIITVGPAGEGPRPTLEQDMLEPGELPGATELSDIESQVTGMGDALWDPSELHKSLGSWVHAVSERGVFEGALAPQSQVSSQPTVHLAPAIILRKRTERSLLRMLQEIVEQLRHGQPIPAGVQRLVTIVDDAASLEGEAGTTDARHGISIDANDVYFPLPANAEQQLIAKRLSLRQGILVQGPPGTGKSHTIANLVSHLLATGQRILVTSHTSRALRVLRGKLPKDVAQLCVLLLGDDLGAMQALEDSVQGITEKYNLWDAEQNGQLIGDLEKKLDEVRRTEARITGELTAIREAATYRHPTQFGSYEGTAQSIAAHVREEAPLYQWLSLSPDEPQEPPLSDAEAKELIGLFRTMDRARAEELKKACIDPASLPTPAEFTALVKREAEARSRHEAVASHRDDPAYGCMSHTDSRQRERLLEGLSKLISAYQTVTRHIQPWAKEAATQIVADRDRAWRELLTITKQHLDAIADRCRTMSDRQVSGLAGRDRATTKAHALRLLQHLEAGGNLGLGPFRPPVVKDAAYLTRNVRVDGSLCDRPRPLRELLEWIEIVDHLEALKLHWSGRTDPPSGTFAAQAAEYQDLCEPLEQALQLHGMVTELKATIAGISGLAEPTWHRLDELKALHEAGLAAVGEQELAQARSSLDTLQPGGLSSDSHPIMQLLADAITLRDVRRFSESYEALCQLGESRRDLLRLRSRFSRLEAVAPGLAQELLSTFENSAWDQRMSGFTHAWNWARADRWVRRFDDSRRQQTLCADLDLCRTGILGLTGSLAAAKAWRHCLSRLNEHERQHLMAWTKAVRRIGKGTGKYAALHRRAARDHMAECRSAIPAWIMPIYRVAETMKPGKDNFDVVIVDEASQSGPEALFLQYLAKKVVVVGDDKQISPENVGIDREDVMNLRQRHISDLPHSDALGLDNSFFDQAEIRYGGRIRLREHFRCMPEIIQFSNNLCYAGEPLQPLRQYGSGRLTPVVTARHVPEGYQRGGSSSVVNPPEAEAVANQIKLCCADPAYGGKSIGVISLLGEGQARLIESMLSKSIGPEEMEKRGLVCGDAYAFQGDERDVMFLSMVSAPTEGHRIGTLASPRDERRFNVAASRAKDQLWLFHSATLNHLSPRCLRYRLLEYCQNPKVDSTVVGGIDIDALRATARSADRDRSNPPHPFDSWFEVDVLLKVADRGYRVVPQVEAAGFRIDLVVEGMNGRLGVECDGDTWHGPDRFEEDMARQRMLVRCGWSFWRILGSAFYRDPDGSLEDLWRTLECAEIHPASRTGQDLPAARPTTATLTSHCEVGGRFQPESKGEPEEANLTKRGSGEPSHDVPGGPAARPQFPMQMQPASPSLKSQRYEQRVDFPEIAVTSAAPEGRAHSASPDPEGTDEERVKAGNHLADTAARSSHPFLQPYRSWSAKPLPDPRDSEITDVLRGLVEIIEAEGPMPCHLAYTLYVKAAGIQRVGRQIRSIFNRAIYRAKSVKLLEEVNEYGTDDQLNRIVRKWGRPPVVPRTRGNRTFDEIPPSEISAVIDWLLTRDPTLGDEELFRLVLRNYEIDRMTLGIRATLARARELSGGENSSRSA